MQLGKKGRDHLALFSIVEEVGVVADDHLAPAPANPREACGEDHHPKPVNLPKGREIQGNGKLQVLY